MLNDIAIEAFNSKVTVNVNNIKTMSAAELDRVKQHGSEAEALLKNKSLALFVHQTKFAIGDALSDIKGHSEEDNNKRIALSNQLAGIDTFVETLKQAIYLRNLVVKQQGQVPATPTDI